MSSRMSAMAWDGPADRLRLDLMRRFGWRASASTFRDAEARARCAERSTVETTDVLNAAQHSKAEPLANWAAGVIRKDSTL